MDVSAEELINISRAIEGIQELEKGLGNVCFGRIPLTDDSGNSLGTLVPNDELFLWASDAS